jgi:uncharacterized protein DUF6600
VKTPAIFGIVGLLLVAVGCAGTYQEVPARHAYRTEYRAGSIAIFYDELSPYGRWIEYSPYGTCWTPYGMDTRWRPYSNGHWIYTEWGWTWASDEPWGWASYHYGRWLLDPDYGWLWVPGTVWAPAWVAWRDNDDWVGWAPLPPQAQWDASIGLRFGDSERIAASSWCFLPRQTLAASSVRPHVVTTVRNAILLSQTRDATRFSEREGRPVNDGVDITQVERDGRPIPRLKVADADSPSAGRGQVVRAGVVRFFRPEVRGALGRLEPAPRVEARETARDLGPASRVSPREAPVPVMERRREAARRKLEASLERERERLEHQQARELRSQARDERVQTIRRRQAAEKQAFEDRVAARREALEQRFQKVANPKGTKDEDDQDRKGAGKAKDAPAGRGSQR